jgi:hypothetical protein
LAGFIVAFCPRFYFSPVLRAGAWLFDKKGLPTSLQYYLRITQKMEYHNKRANNLFGLSFFNIMNSITTFLSVPLRFINRQRKTGLESAYEVSAPHC